MHAPDVIEVLPGEVIDQIAAGEVIERPASVVKELTENALDAGATQITVDVEGGGRRLIRVVDDGCGMSARDARRALERHATSKLRAVEDLWGLATMGFRGEALSSIASVSRMTLTTRRRADLAATKVIVDGGRIIEIGEAGGAPGTCIEVRDLLHNVPVRLRFLKGEATEASHVTEAIERLAMTHPSVHLRLRHHGRASVDCPPVTAGIDRVRMVLGARLGAGLHEVSGEEGGVRVTAYLGAPDLAGPTARGVQLYVGRRFVRDRALLHAVTMGYGELVPRGRYPIAVVMIEVPGRQVDVNVHPQKLEVRFSDAGAVTAAVRHVVRKGIAAAPWLGGAAPIQASTTPPVGQRAGDLARRYAEATTRALFPMGGLPRASDPSAGPRSWAADVRARAASAPVPGASSASVPASVPGAASASVPASVPAAAAGADAAAVTADYFARLRYLGQLDRTYLVCEGDGELVLIDQHAAHERVEFQRLRDRSATRDVPVQRLLFPLTVDVPADQHALVEDSADLLAAAGFEIEPFGGATVAVKAMPAGLRHDPATVVRELLADLAERGGSRAVEERLDLVLATIACHSVVRAGDTLGPREAEALLGQMDGIDFRAHCPHGRPVLLRVGVPEIARRLGR